VGHPVPADDPHPAGRSHRTQHTDFGSGRGITADYLAENNTVTAIEPDEKQLSLRRHDHAYRQIVGNEHALSSFADGTFDLVICHNVLEYIDDKAFILRELARVLRKGGSLSLVKHNRAGRVMQMAVLLDDFDKANALLDGGNSSAAQFGPIRYFEDDDVPLWAPALRLQSVRGLRCFWDLQQNQQKQTDEAWQVAMIRLETRVSELDDYRRIAFFHHLMLVKQ